MRERAGWALCMTKNPLAGPVWLGYAHGLPVSSPSPRALRFVPLGGLGEIGMNCFALEQEDGILVVDCGTAFPHNDIGIDVLHPDFSWLQAERARVSGVFLTHAHEDHIGAVPYLLKRLRVPVWGPPHALALVRHRLAEHQMDMGELTLNEAVAGRRYQVGPFGVEPVRVSHSIVEASALCIETCQGTVFHTGDFNLDPAPPDGEPTDVERLKAIGAAGVRLLLSDSTNIDVAERAGSEREVGEALRELVLQAPARVVVAMFASNVQRLRMLGEIAQASGRNICLLGRSLNVHVEVARRVGRLDWPSNLTIAPDQVRWQRRGSLLVLAGGSQGEATSALRRLASETHQHLRLEPGDRVIHSARVIPGNERGVHELFCDLLRLGVRLHTRITDPGIHTSGHAGRSEQAQMIRWLEPRAFVPVHGTLHHLQRHAALARELGIEACLVVENGASVMVDDTGLRPGAPVPHGKVSVAYGGEVLTGEAARRRIELGRAGVVCVSLVLSADGRCLGAPRVQVRGVPSVDDVPAALSAVAREVRRAVDACRHSARADAEDEVRRAARRVLFEWSGSRPQIVVLLHLDAKE